MIAAKTRPARVHCPGIYRIEKLDRRPDGSNNTNMSSSYGGSMVVHQITKEPDQAPSNSVSCPQAGS